MSLRRTRGTDEPVPDGTVQVTYGEEVWYTYHEAVLAGLVMEDQARVIGPRLEGGFYRDAFWSDTYEVVSIRCGYRYVTRKRWGYEKTVDLESTGLQIMVRWSHNFVDTHCSPWHERDTVVAQPQLQCRVPRKVKKYVRVVPRSDEHLCSLCRPGIIGMMERQYRRGELGLGQLMRDVDLIRAHHNARLGTQGVTLVKSHSTRTSGQG